jgi:hypothetical protein
MKAEKLEKANQLQDRINKLSIMQRELRPEFCNGVGICGSMKKNDGHHYYQFNLWSTHKSNTDDNSLIMRVGIIAMYNEVSRLLKEAELEFEALT